MWQKLILDYKDMEDHIEEHRVEAMQLLRIMESMYRLVRIHDLTVLYVLMGY